MATPADETRNTGNDDDCQHTGNETNQSNHSRRVADSPAPISLAQRAPVGPIARRGWHGYVRYGLAQIQFENLLEQKNQCIRSLRVGRNGSLDLVPSLLINDPLVVDESTRFPYPPAFQKMFREQLRV
jgi:hypothetical protein